MTYEERENFIEIIKAVSRRDEGSFHFMQQYAIPRIPVKAQNLPFVQAIVNGIPGEEEETLDQALYLLCSDLMELAENEYNNGLPQNV